MKVEFRARKILSPLFQYEPFDNKEATAWRKRLGIRDEEIPCGIYSNGPGSSPESLVVTTKGLHLLGNSAQEFVSFDEVRSIGSPTKESDDLTLSLRLATGQEVEVAICGRQGRFKDIFEFLRFLMRVTVNREDYQTFS